MKILTKGNYYGDRDIEVSYKGVLLSQYTYTGVKTDWHYHENPYFMYVLHGNMQDCNKKVSTSCPPGSLLFTNWQEPHYGAKHTTFASGFHVEFDRQWLCANGWSLDLLEGSHHILHPKVHFLFAKLYNELLVSDQFSEVSVELLLLQVCEALSDPKTTASQKCPAWVSGLKELVHYDTNNISLQYLSEQLQVHPVHISRAASKYLAVSLGEYIRQHKLKNALPLLWDATYSLTDIAYHAGFSDQSHFNRVFKAHFEISPGVFRKRLKKI